MDSAHESMYQVYRKCKKKYEKEGHKIDYHYWTCGYILDVGLVSIMNYQKIAYEIDNLYDSPYEYICIIGHSYGGDTARTVASLCKCPIRLLVTLDPVSARAHTKLSISKPTNVIQWINVYAPVSVISMLGGHWGRQKEANINIYCNKIKEKNKNGAVVIVAVEHGDADIMFNENEVVKNFEDVLNSTKPPIPALSKININKELFQKDMKLPVDALLVKPSFSNKEYHINSQEPTGLISVKGAFSKSLRRIKSIKPLKKK